MIKHTVQEKCVHTEHCCRVHGCKYNDELCPVWLGRKVQSYPCEACDFEVNGHCFINDPYVYVDINDIPKIPAEEFLNRRKEVD